MFVIVIISYLIHGEVSDEPPGISKVHIGGSGAVTLIIDKDLNLVVMEHAQLK